jgi:hypothetical protein
LTGKERERERGAVAVAMFIVLDTKCMNVINMVDYNYSSVISMEMRCIDFMVG